MAESTCQICEERDSILIKKEKKWNNTVKDRWYHCIM